MKKICISIIAIVLITSCKNLKEVSDAEGMFEANEVIVSAKQSGELLSFNIHEGDKIEKNKVLGEIDIRNIILQKNQVEASIDALNEKLNVATPQIEITQKQLEAQQSQLSYLLREKERILNLLRADAATMKQSDDINNQVDAVIKQIAILKQQIESSKSTIYIQNKGILSEKKPLEKSVEQLEDQIKKGNIINPINGVVLTQYAFVGEMTNIGKALYKIANIDTITLKAYISGSQIPKLKIGQRVIVKTDDGNGSLKEYPGILQWISDKSEFTPKTIQTKDERQNLVYAIKISVVNDGYIKLGMYGAVKF